MCYVYLYGYTVFCKVYFFLYTIILDKKAISPSKMKKKPKKWTKYKKKNFQTIKNDKVLR